ncbi:cysteine desulfurase [Kosmotoga arenicorallina S304]|uniref:cysteine desulfurase n=1 Tax=Kosmotoga arenicorallina S304 TaxID=1453497 RepID=A0A182C7U8_9BACT|nr:aminotransferase class V-fold PLP-dependent enzyme [Kosmotoga arenicorallina]OAA31410.1 cysteine desulfurase [Kosmotoga arenicorallina S304]
MSSVKELDEYFKKLKADFPIFSERPDLVYLDNAATTQKPSAVIEKLRHFYVTANANVHRAVYRLAEESTALYEESRKTVADFIGTAPEEIIFTRGTTESLNLLAYSLGLSGKYKSFIVPLFEHHSNFVPWQQIAHTLGLKFYPVKIHGGELFLEDVEAIVKSCEKPFVFSMTGLTNSLGYRAPFEAVAKLVHSAGGIFVLDAAQLIPHEAFDFAASDIDFLAFSGHKILGPTGIGVLAGKKELLEQIRPFQYGGEMIDKVGEQDTTFAPVPYKFEAGTPNIAGAAGLAEALKYVKNISYEKISKHIENLTKNAIEKLSVIPGLTLYCQKNCHGIISFSHENIHPHDLAELLSRLSGVAVRSGHHCSQQQLKVLGVSSLCRASFYLYNTHNDIDKLVAGIQDALRWFS